MAEYFAPAAGIHRGGLMPDTSADPRIGARSRVREFLQLWDRGDVLVQFRPGSVSRLTYADLSELVDAYDRARGDADQYNAAVNSLSDDNGRIGTENEALRRLTASLRADLEQMTAQRDAGRVWEARVKAADADRDRLAATVETLERQLREAGGGWDAASAELDRLRAENEALRAENAVAEDEARDSIATAERVMADRDRLAAQVQRVRDVADRLDGMAGDDRDDAAAVAMRKAAGWIAAALSPVLAEIYPDAEQPEAGQ